MIKDGDLTIICEATSIETLLKEIEVRSNSSVGVRMENIPRLLEACRELVRGLEYFNEYPGAVAEQTLARATAILVGERLEGEGK